MKEKEYYKLVRDNIPDIIKGEKCTPIYRELYDDEYIDYLLDKDAEELEELRDAPSLVAIKDELADKFEILLTIARYYGFNLEDIIEEADIKRNKNGGFEKRLLLEKVIEEENNR